MQKAHQLTGIILSCCRFPGCRLFSWCYITASNRWNTYWSSVWHTWTKSLHFRLNIPHTVCIHWNIQLSICTYDIVVGCFLYQLECCNFQLMVTWSPDLFSPRLAVDATESATGGNSWHSDVVLPVICGIGFMKNNWKLQRSCHIYAAMIFMWQLSNIRWLW